MERINLGRAFHLVYLGIVGYIVSWAGALAVIDGLTGRRSVFRRTPKFGLIDRYSQTRTKRLVGT